MASTYSALKIELLETGANSGTWGTATNVNLGDAVLGEAITGSATVNFCIRRRCNNYINRFCNHSSGQKSSFKHYRKLYRHWFCT